MALVVGEGNRQLEDNMWQDEDAAAADIELANPWRHPIAVPDKQSPDKKANAKAWARMLACIGKLIYYGD
ncbi:uncharacterized protein N7503_000737 [Penicillium pulvis]|uniref:uncharacterized protein n=1 Tax=Penicillium pulvis TaxID=1562058 RepID=UPI0025483F96|nr:uncharacterized protein N7503_000737 [Penicillium pulvis]KAJ5813987.1 hypothetical protein N7503_000737 [Penicillium pulvis]